MTRIFAAALLLAGQLAAQPAPKKKAPAQPRKDAPAAARKSPAPAPAPGKEAAPDPAAAEQAAQEAEGARALARLQEWDAKLETLKADFTQEVEFRDAGLKQKIEGTLLYAKPGLLRIEHLKPAKQVVVTDKKDIWIYKPADSQAVKTSWDAWRRTQDQNLSGVLDFGNYAALAGKNRAAAKPGRDGLLELTLTPRSGPGYTLKLLLSPEDYFPAGAELAVDSAYITTRLAKTEKNGAVDRELFRFAPPKGTEVLKLKD